MKSETSPLYFICDVFPTFAVAFSTFRAEAILMYWRAKYQTARSQYVVVKPPYN